MNCQNLSKKAQLFLNSFAITHFLYWRRGNNTDKQVPSLRSHDVNTKTGCKFWFSFVSTFVFNPHPPNPLNFVSPFCCHLRKFVVGSERNELALCGCQKLRQTFDVHRFQGHLRCCDRSHCCGCCSSQSSSFLFNNPVSLFLKNKEKARSDFWFWCWREWIHSFLAL